MAGKQSSTAEKRVCSFEGCPRDATCRGLCASHYAQIRRGQPLRSLRGPKRRQKKPRCAFSGCTHRASAKGLCVGHRKQQRKNQRLHPLRDQPSRVLVDDEGRTYIELLDLHGNVEGKAYISPEDAEKVKRRRWHRRKKGYAGAHKRAGGVLLHRFLLDAPPELQVDHEDGDPTNNLRSNLRFVTRSQQMQNRVTPNKTGYRNVYQPSDKGGRYRVEVKGGDGKMHRGGYFTDIKEAVAKAKELRSRVQTHNNENRPGHTYRNPKG